MARRKDKKGGGGKPLGRVKALDLNTKALKSTQTELKSMTKKLGSSFTSMSKALKTSSDKVGTSIDLNIKSIDLLTKALKGLESTNKKAEASSKASTGVEAKIGKPSETSASAEAKIGKSGKKSEGPEKPPAKPTAAPAAGGLKGGGVAGMGLSVANKLMGAVMGLYEFQDKFTKLLVSTGNQTMGDINQLSNTFEARGISLETNLDLLASVLEGGIGEYSRTLGTFSDSLSSAQSKDLQVKTLAEYKHLGKDTKALAAMMGSNSQVLGISHTQTAQLASKLVGLGAAYGFNSDKLVSALNALSDTFMKSASVYGADTAAAGQEAIANLTAKLGTAQEKNIQSLARTLMSGTKEAGITAMKLGVRLEDINSSNAATQEAAMMQALNSLNKQTDAGGAADAGLWINDMVKALGANDEMLNLARHANQLTTKQIETNLEKAAEEARVGSMKASIDQLIHDAVKALLPAMDILVPILSNIAKIVGAMENTVKIIMYQMIARQVGKMATAGVARVKQIPQNRINKMDSKGMRFTDAKSGKFVNAEAGKAGLLGGTTKAAKMNKAQRATIKNSKNLIKNGKKIAKFGAKFGGKFLMRGMSVLLGPWGLLLGLIPDILSMFGISLFGDKEAEKDRKKTIEILEKPDPNVIELKSIARMINQSNIYLEKQNLLKEEELDLSKDEMISNDQRRNSEYSSDTFITPNSLQGATQ